MKLSLMCMIICLISLACAVGCDAPRRRPISSWTLSFRVAADRSRDERIVAQALENENDNVGLNGALVAKWVRVADRKKDDLRNDGSLVTRLSPQGDLSLLVLLDPFDVTEHHLISVGRAKDDFGKPKVEISFSDTGAALFGGLTGSNIGRHLAAIVNGRVTDAVEVQSTITGYALIPGDFTQAEVDRMVGGFVLTY